MPGPLENARRELFCQELVQGKSQQDAYTAAGYKGDRTAACRMAAKPDIMERMQELQGAAAQEVICTIHDIARQLDEDRQFARELEAPGAAITATMGKAKVLGLLVERQEHTGKDGGPIELVSSKDAARRIAFLLNKGARSK